MPVTERLYIGGLDPPRLTVQDVLDRLLPVVQNQVELHNITERSSYCHFDAISLKEDRTALETISKLYNGVIWKGCKIRVQAAKPHFLERLAREIQDRQKQQQQQFCVEDKAEEQSSAKKTSTGTIPRHLKVRKGYGQVSFRVDTKPCRVSDLPSFTKMRSKLLRKQQQQKDDVKQQHRSHWNRAVHLRFFDREEIVNGVVLEEQLTNGKNESSTNEDSSSSDDDSSSSATSTDGEIDMGRAQNTGTYVWSDSSMSQEEEREEEEVDGHDDGGEGHHPDESLQPREDRTYQWSDDNSPSSSSSSSSNESTSRSNVYARHLSSDHLEATNGKDLNRIVVDEFSPGIDTGLARSDNFVVESSDAKFSCNDNEGDDDLNPFHTESSENDVLKQDVQSNLNVLAALFPELAGTKPCNLESDQKTKDKESDTMKSGWGAKGQMLRFDPSNQTAGRFVLEKSQDDMREKSDGDSDEELQLPKQEQVGIQQTEKMKNVYEQGKLEDVFRRSRKQVTVPDSDTPRDTGGEFSFGFQVDAPAPRPNNESNEFSFSFRLLESSNDPANADAILTSPETVENKMDENNEPSHTKKHRMGPFFPEEDIEYYVKHFYALNDGKRIQEDFEGFRNDPKVEQDWDRQRRILTEDWKRKRKHAQNKRRKRV